MECVDIIFSVAEDCNEENISQDPDDCSDKEEESLQPPFQVIHGDQLP